MVRYNLDTTKRQKGMCMISWKAKLIFISILASNLYGMNHQGNRCNQLIQRIDREHDYCLYCCKGTVFIGIGLYAGQTVPVVTGGALCCLQLAASYGNRNRINFWNMHNAHFIRAQARQARLRQELASLNTQSRESIAPPQHIMRDRKK